MEWRTVMSHVGTTGVQWHTRQRNPTCKGRISNGRIQYIEGVKYTAKWQIITAVGIRRYGGYNSMKEHIGIAAEAYKKVDITVRHKLEGC
jgi:hypothetical protein